MLGLLLGLVSLAPRWTEQPPYPPAIADVRASVH